MPYRILILFICMLSFNSGFSQSFRFDYFGIADGIPEDFAYSIIQDERGYLLVSTDEGIFQYNGFDFTNIYTVDDKTKFVSSFKSSNGDIWFGKNRGGILRYTNNVFDTIPFFSTEDTLQKAANISRVTDFLEFEGDVWVATQSSGIYKVADNGEVTKYYKGLEEFNIFSFAISDGGFLIGTDMGLYLSQLKNEAFTSTEVDDIFYTNITSITNSDFGYIVGTQSMGAFNLHLDNSGSLTIDPITIDGQDLSKFHINHIFSDENNSMWVSTNKNGLLQLGMDNDGNCQELIMYNQGGLKEVKTVNECFIDRERNVWIASIDEGVVSLRNDYFSFYQLNDISPDKEVFALAKAEANTFWLGTESRVLKCSISPWAVVEEYSTEQGLPLTEYSSLLIDDQETIWVSTIDQGLYYKKNEDEKFTRISLPLEYQDKTIYHISLFQSKLYLSTDFGLIEIENGKYKQIYKMNSGLPHNKIASTYPNGDRLMVATRANEIAYLQGDSVYIEKIPMTQDYRDSGMMQYVKDNTDKLWVSTSGAGVSSVEGESSVMINESDGLMSNFIYSMLVDANNNLWMSHRGGLSKYHIHDQISTTYDPVKGRNLDFANNAALMDENKRLWFGTNRGLIRYRADLDYVNNQSPIINIIEVEVNKERAYYTDEDKIQIDYDIKDFSIKEEKKYDIKVEYEGVSLKEPDGVVYYYKIVDRKDNIPDELDAKDLSGWTKTNDRETAQIKVVAGDYLFKIMAYNADGIGGANITSVNIFIDKPIWEKKEFWITLALLVGTIFFVVIKMREQRYKKTQAYLEKELDLRTKEVVSQKEVLEVINNDLTDSIEYAKNIQTAILPPPDALPAIFSDAFVFYKPRDIVSGDFYWVERYGDYITLAVADCTGHGVPGAFMSLIGSALLKDISSRKDVNSPEVLMVQLDIELKAMLNKKDSKFGVHDGMDITVIEFNLANNKLKVCSGKRPVVLYIGGQQVSLKGDRASVGGYGETADKDFTISEFQLSKGDRIYMYSDGIVDQFGGEKGKKLKNRAFVKYLDEIQNQGMNQQQVNMTQFFKDWKGDLAQIDDVIVVGIEV